MIFNDEVKTNRGVDLALMKVIHQSVHNRCKGFYVEYQPIVDSQTGRVKGAEALIRWESEPYGNVPPGMFIDWLEKDLSLETSYFVRPSQRLSQFLILILTSLLMSIFQ